MEIIKVRCNDGRLAVFQIDKEKDTALLVAYDEKGKVEERKIVTLPEARELWKHLARTVGGRIIK